VSGTITCASGNSVVGVWVQAAAGSEFADWQGIGNGNDNGNRDGSTSEYWTTTPITEPYSLHVGCGGSSNRWETANYSDTVSGAVNDFYCIDISRSPEYETCTS
jgi:hypothetical protein